MYRRHLEYLICNNGYKIRPPESRTIAHEECERSPGISGAASGIGSVNSGIDTVIPELAVLVPYVSVYSLQGCRPAPPRMSDMLSRVQDTSSRSENNRTRKVQVVEL